MPAHVKVGGAWRAFHPRVKVGGAWHNLSAGWVKVGGVWRKWYPSGVTDVVTNTTFNSASGLKQVQDLTCPAGAQLFALASFSNCAMPPAPTDSQGGAWALWDYRVWADNQRVTGIYYRGTLTGSGGIVVNMTPSGDQGGGFTLVRAMGLTGPTGRQSGGATGASGTPSVVLGSAVLPTSLVMGVFGSDSSGPAAPTGWTNLGPFTHLTPNGVMVSCYIGSGETRQVIPFQAAGTNWTLVYAEITTV